MPHDLRRSACQISQINQANLTHRANQAHQVNQIVTEPQVRVSQCALCRAALCHDSAQIMEIEQ